MKGRASKWLCKGPALVLLLVGGVREEVGQQMAAGGCERVRRLEAECAACRVSGKQVYGMDVGLEIICMCLAATAPSRKMQEFTPGSDAVTGPGRALESLGGGLRSDMKRGAGAVLPASSSRSHLPPARGIISLLLLSMQEKGFFFGMLIPVLCMCCLSLAY